MQNRVNIHKYYDNGAVIVFPGVDAFVVHLQQTTFVNIVAKGEIAHHEPFLSCHNVFNSIRIHTFMYIYFRYFSKTLKRSSTANVILVGKGFKYRLNATNS